MSLGFAERDLNTLVTILGINVLSEWIGVFFDLAFSLVIVRCNSKLNRRFQLCGRLKNPLYSMFSSAFSGALPPD